ncbi:MAG: hypothetical protein SFY67_06105 [Candidatus Melainabacteria bacterium]|nr:hypothetical protein [Candidatus Melainabacteria bacterium]
MIPLYISTAIAILVLFFTNAQAGTQFFDFEAGAHTKPTGGPQHK